MEEPNKQSKNRASTGEGERAPCGSARRWAKAAENYVLLRMPRTCPARAERLPRGGLAERDSDTSPQTSIYQRSVIIVLLATVWEAEQFSRPARIQQLKVELGREEHGTLKCLEGQCKLARLGLLTLVSAMHSEKRPQAIAK
jgi:hypothetical protein